MNHRTNNFDFIRFLAASFVLYGHCEVLNGSKATKLAGLAVPGLGVLIFFSLSGYLVTESLQRHRSVPAFLAKRSLRIFPALAVVVTLTTYALGPAMTTLHPHDYFQSWVLGHYMQCIRLYVSFYLPGVFENNIYKTAVNGSLWSLPAEFLCYLIVAVSGFFPQRIGRWGLAVGVLVTAGLNLYARYYTGSQIIYYSTDPFQWAAVAVCFFFGGVYSAFRIPLYPKVGFGVLVLIFLWARVLQSAPPDILVWAGLPYIVLALGSQATPVMRSWGRFGDLSYGLYLYSFPITQTVIAIHRNNVALTSLIVYVAALSICCAFLSWHLVEKWALKLKHLPHGDLWLGQFWESLAPMTGVRVGAGRAMTEARGDVATFSRRSAPGAED